VSPNAEKQIFGDPLPAEILKKKAIEKETCVRQRSFFRILLGDSLIREFSEIWPATPDRAWKYQRHEIWSCGLWCAAAGLR